MRVGGKRAAEGSRQACSQGYSIAHGWEEQSSQRHCQSDGGSRSPAREEGAKQPSFRGWGVLCVCVNGLRGRGTRTWH
eukprot:6058346-Prymnesium_polylepis.1